MDLQSYRHDCFSKISRTLFDFLNNTYWVSLFVRNNSLILRTGVSCFSVTLFYPTLFCCGGKDTLLLYSLDPHGQNYRRRNKYTRFAWAGGTCTRFAWAGGTFFPVVLLCQFLVLVGNRFWLYILLCTWSTIQCGVVLVFLVLAGNSFWCYIHTYCTIQLCGCVSFFVVAGKLILYEYLTVTIVPQKY